MGTHGFSVLRPALTSTSRKPMTSGSGSVSAGNESAHILYLIR
ncbi:MAG: hypothetical protein V2A79_04250 [Planctomycetota bacterium]